MNSASRHLLAFSAAAILPALAITVPYAISSVSMGDGYGLIRTGNFGVIAVAISAVHVAILGIPAFLLLRWRHAVSWWSAIGVGFILGCIPLGIWSWPLRYPERKSSASNWDGEEMVQTTIDGAPTIAGWVSYAESIGYMGIFGAIGGFGFWLVWRTFRPNQSMQPDQPATGR